MSRGAKSPIEPIQIIRAYFGGFSHTVVIGCCDTYIKGDNSDFFPSGKHHDVAKCVLFLVSFVK